MLKWMKRILSGGMQLDLHPKHIAPEDYVRSLNIYNGVSRSGKHFIVQNIDGTRKVNYTLPLGSNKVIGRFEDKENQTCIYMVWNSNGEHSILRYYLSTNIIVKVLQESLLNFDQNNPIGSVNLVDELFSWTTGDGNPQREFNIVRAQRQDENGIFKVVEMDVYFDLSNQFTNGNEYRISFIDLNNALNTFLFYTSADESLEDGIRNWVTAFNSNANINSFFVAESCGSFIRVSGLVGGIYTVNFGVSNANPLVDPKIKRVFTNIYPDDFLETFINADKNPPKCEPSVSILTDAGEKNNFITGKVFEFQVAYVYTDEQISSLSPISIHPLGIGNYIKIDFTDDRLNDDNLAIVKGVRLYVREGELGKLKFITQLDRYQFGIGVNYYNFFNDKSYSEIDDAYAIKLFEAIPITSESQEVFDNRKGYGDNTEGYDRVCVETQLSVSYRKPPELFTIKGIIIIRSLYNAQEQNGVIYSNTAGTFFGRKFDIQTVPQGLVMNGFTVYLSGTEFYGVSKQGSTWSTNQNYNTGVYNFPAAFSDVDSLNQSNRDAFKSGNPFNLGTTAADGYDVVDQNGNYVGDRAYGIATNTSSEIYSTFEINGVPEGEYIVRIAGTETTPDDLAGTGYQKTSTYTIAVGAAASTYIPAIPQGFEYKVQVGSSITSYVNSNGAVTAEDAGNVIYIGCSAVADLTRVLADSPKTGITGYLCDSDLSSTPTTYDEILQDTRIERALLEFSKAAFQPINCTFNNPNKPNWSQRAWVSQRAVTDHNGFFWYVCSGLGATQINNILVGQNPFLFTVSYLQAFKSDDTPITATTLFTGGNLIAIRNGNTNIKEKRRTFIKGRILDGTNPQMDIPAVNALGSWTRTDELGIYLLPCYADTFYSVIISPVLQPTDPVRYTEVVFSSKNNSIVYNFADDSLPNPFVLLDIGVQIGSYNNTSTSFWYLLPDNQADLLEEFLGISGFKRGLSEEFGVIYYDRENRQTTINDHIRKVYIPFYTENQIAGSAAINWEIQSSPPDWATHYQWVRTHSTPQFLQFNATSITYVDSADNVTSFTNAVFIKIGFNSLLDYQNRYPNTSIGYTFEQGDRVRLISNGSGNFFATYLDTEVVKDFTSGNNYFIYVEKSNTQFLPDVGTLFEIYTPKPSSAIQFYEFGECFEIGNPHEVGRFHRGLTQDQDPNDPINTPATGTFETGNVFYRFRNFVLGGAKYIEDSSVSDFYESFTTQTGRPQILDKNAKQVHRPTLIRFSNQYLSGSSVNGFSSFEALNQKELDRVFGGIRIMRLMAQSVLLVVCESRTQTFYVNKATINIPSNTPNLISLSDAVLNQADTLIGEWGIQHKLSFDSYDNLAWWNDHKKGVVPRYASNGLFLVSDYGTKSYFNERSLISTPNIVGGYDAFHNLFILSFGDVQARDGETIVFNDGAEQGKNRWVSFYSFLPDCIGRIGNVLITFKDGDLYIHDSPVRNNFYGIQYISQFEIAANDVVSDRKVIESSALESLQAWETTAKVEPNAMRPVGQITTIKKGKYLMKEGQFFSEFQGDINSLGGIINGDKLRGEYFLITYTNDSTDFTELYCVNISFVDSPRNIGK